MKTILVIFFFARSKNVVEQANIPKQRTKQQTIAYINGYAQALANRTCYEIEAGYDL